MKRSSIYQLLFSVILLINGSNDLLAQKNDDLPEGAIVLFDGSRESLDQNWTYWEGPRLKAKPPIKWKIVNDPVGKGTAVSSNDPAGANGLYGAADIVTRQKFEDFQLHIEFLIENEGGNSGVYLQNRYEIQILDGDSTDHGMAAVINEKSASYRPYKGLGKWNEYDIIFRAARFDETGKKVEHALVTVYFNGEKVHSNVPITKVWGGAFSGIDGGNNDGYGITDRPGGIKLQAEGHDVLYRNIWIKPLTLNQNQTDLSGIFETSPQELQPFQEGDRIAFLGNSITHAGLYESYIWLYYMTHFPDREITILNAGSGGDVAGQMNDRFEEDVLPMDPDVVVLTFGMNDSGYFEFWQEDADETAKERVAKSLKSFEQIQEKFRAYPEITPVIMSSSPYDETAKIEGSNNFSGKSKTLEEIVAFQEKAAEENDWAFVDLYFPMKEITEREQQKDSSYTITGSDRIHPGKPGHLVMAALFLKNQGLAGKPVSKVEIDAKRAKLVGSENASVKINAANESEVSFDYLAESLPFPIDSVSTLWENPQKQSEALAVYPFIKEFNQETLQVRNLKDGDYRLVIDGENIAEFSADSLSKGINLALLSNTPQYKQAKNVMFLNDQRAEIEGKLREYYWAQFNYFREKDLLFEDSQRAYDMASQEKEGFIGSKMGIYRTARFPEVREMWEENMKVLIDKIYEINKPESHKIQIIRLQKE